MPLILKSVVLFSLAAGLIAGCAKEKDAYNIIPNNPQSAACYDVDTKTAKNCDDTDYNTILESINEWRISAYNYKHISTPLKSREDSSYKIRFSKGAMNGSLGCNNFFGGYSINNGILTIGNAGMTRKMCDPKTMENEAILTKHFLNAETKILMLKDNEQVGKIFLVGKDFYLVLD